MKTQNTLAFLAMLATASALAGCYDAAYPPPGYARPLPPREVVTTQTVVANYTVEETNANRVIIRSVPGSVPPGVIAGAAQQACGQFGKNAVLRRSMQRGPNVQADTFRCVWR